MKNEDINTVMERYKKEMIDFNRRKTIKAEETPKVQKRDNLEKENKAEYTTEQRGAGEKSKTQRKIEPLEQEKNETKGKYTLEGMNDNQKLDNKKKIVRNGEIPIVGNMTKRNTDSSKKKYSDYIKNLTGSGTIKVKTFSSYGLYPISNVHVVIYKEFEDENYYIYDRYTDGSGIIKDLTLPAPSKSYSQTPENSGVRPYAEYNIYVEHPNFVNLLYENVPVFDGIISIQGVEMVPELNNTQSNPELVLEKEPNSL